MRYTFPPEEMLEEQRRRVPDYMHPNSSPWFVVSEGHLTEQTCRDIQRAAFAVEPYTFEHCNASTREFAPPLDSIFDPISQFLLESNEAYWQYDLGDEGAAWLQTYFEGNDYQLHMDGAIGQVRKLTAVALLSDSNDYVGGDLHIHIPPNDLVVPRTKGTIVVFPFWVLHEVAPITRGMRQSVNLGYWGPPFK